MLHSGIFKEVLKNSATLNKYGDKKKSIMKPYEQNNIYYRFRTEISADFSSNVKRVSSMGITVLQYGVFCNLKCCPLKLKRFRIFTTKVLYIFYIIFLLKST